MFSLFMLLLVKNTIAGTAFLEVEFFRNGTARITNFSYTPMNFETFFSGKGFGEYKIEIVDKNRNILYSEKFGGLIFQVKGYTETGEEIVIEEIESINKTFRLHLPENSYLIIFYKNGREILSLSLSTYICNYNNVCEEDLGESKYLCEEECEISTKTVCGNRVCESSENYTTCCLDCGCPSGFVCRENKCVENRCGNKICESFSPYDENYKTCKEDCPPGSKDNYCDGVSDGICDPDCKKEEDIDCVKPVATWIYFVIVGIIAGLVFLIIIWSKIG